MRSSSSADGLHDEPPNAHATHFMQLSLWPLNGHRGLALGRHFLARLRANAKRGGPRRCGICRGM